jgi:hypothetical protein
MSTFRTSFELLTRGRGCPRTRSRRRYAPAGGGVRSVRLLHRPYAELRCHRRRDPGQAPERIRYTTYGGRREHTCPGCGISARTSTTSAASSKSAPPARPSSRAGNVSTCSFGWSEPASFGRVLDTRMTSAERGDVAKLYSDAEETVANWSREEPGPRWVLEVVEIRLDAVSLRKRSLLAEARPREQARSAKALLGGCDE